MVILMPLKMYLEMRVSILNSKLNIVVCILILINIIGVFVNKDNWAVDVEDVGGWQNSLSKILYALVILIMLPSIASKSIYFKSAKTFVLIILLYVFYGIAVDNPFDFGSVSKFLLLCLSFVFFEHELRQNVIDKYLIYAFIVSSLVFTSVRIFSANVLVNAIASGDFDTGQSSSLAVIYLLPLIFLTIDKKISTYIYLFGFVLVLISLRRTAILVYLSSLPFVFTTMKKNLSKRFLLIIITIVGVVVFYFVDEYWWVIEARFLDIFVANEDGAYGSGRTAWFKSLMEIYYEHPENWVQGFGVGAVKRDMIKMGAAFGHAHNDYIEIVFTYGLIGIYLWYSMFLKFFTRIRKSKLSQDEICLSYMCVLIVLLIATATNEIDDPTFIAVPIFMSMIVIKLQNEVNIF